MNEIANVHNDLIDLPLRKFNASEIDILTAICYKCNEKQTNKVVLPLDEIKKLADYKNKNNEMFLDDLKKTNSKLMALNFTIGTTREFTQFVLFPTFEVSDSKGTLTVQVHEKFAYLLNNLKNCYTSLELQESSSLKSSYSKGIYKKLREFRNSDKPFWKVTFDDFKEYLDIPKSYRMTDINKVVINPALKELSPY
ncbi:replication initiation protein, partial [Streptococcus agalactiae]|uniref:replication initiation protein n=1 Tax=Streptococcus agalactiae TaxID=1311 RepID=UPI00037C7E58